MGHNDAVSDQTPGAAAPPKKGGGLIWTGVILLVLGVVGGIVLVVLAATNIGSQFDRQVNVPGRASFNLNSGDYGVYLISSSSTFSTPDVTITDPSGNEVALRRGDSNFNGNSGSNSVRSINEFTATTSGSYTVNAIGGSSTVNQQVAIGPPVSGLVGAVGLIFGGICGGGLFALVGLILLIVGLVSRSRGKKQAATPGGYPGATYGGAPAYGSVPPAPGAVGPPPAPGGYGAVPPAAPTPQPGAPPQPGAQPQPGVPPQPGTAPGGTPPGTPPDPWQR